MICIFRALFGTCTRLFTEVGVEVEKVTWITLPSNTSNGRSIESYIGRCSDIECLQRHFTPCQCFRPEDVEIQQGIQCIICDCVSTCKFVYGMRWRGPNEDIRICRRCCGPWERQMEITMAKIEETKQGKIRIDHDPIYPQLEVEDSSKLAFAEEAATQEKKWKRKQFFQQLSYSHWKLDGKNREAFGQSLESMGLAEALRNGDYDLFLQIIEHGCSIFNGFGPGHRHNDAEDPEDSELEEHIRTTKDERREAIQLRDQAESEERIRLDPVVTDWAQHRKQLCETRQSLRQVQAVTHVNDGSKILVAPGRRNRTVRRNSKGLPFFVIYRGTTFSWTPTSSMKLRGIIVTFLSQKK